LSESVPAGLSGSLNLVCAAHPERGTFVARQSFSAPMHISKTYWDGETLLINVVNQTAGILGGDSIVTHVVIEPGARVLLSSPSAARFHPSRGREARLQQTFEVRAGGSLDVFPEISIPQGDSCSFQKTAIYLEEGGELLYLETLAPGRVASGEAFAFSRYSWWTDVKVADRLVHRERVSLTPPDSSMAGLRALFPASYYASLVLISPASESWKTDFLHAVLELSDQSSTKVAASQLSAHGWSIRILADSSLALRAAIGKLRKMIYERLDRRLPDPRRNG
jgi:urease accessory protein